MTNIKKITVGQITEFLWDVYQVIAIAVLTGMLVGIMLDAVL